MKLWLLMLYEMLFHPRYIMGLYQMGEQAMWNRACTWCIQPSTAPIYSVSAEQLVDIAEPKRRSDRLLAVEEIIRGDK